MENAAQFPLRLDSAFFTRIEASRTPQVPELCELNLSFAVRIHTDKFPQHLQIDLRLESVPDRPVTLCVEMVGQFSHVEDEPLLGKDALVSFVNERGLHVLWPYVARMVRDITSNMGTNPIDLVTPYRFEVTSDAVIEDSKEALGVD